MAYNSRELTFEGLLADPSVKEDSLIQGDIGILAVHGGIVDPGTEQIARYLAGRTGRSFYTVSARGDLPARDYHVSSTRIEPSFSPQLYRVISRVWAAVSVHGYPYDWKAIFLGGRNVCVKELIAEELEASFPDYEIVASSASIPSWMKGQSRKNIVNRPRSQGVQIELPLNLRRGVDGFENSSLEGKTLLAAEAIVRAVGKLK